MARDVIDELSLKIDIDVDKGASKTISSLARAITKLNTAVASVGNLQKYVRSLNSLNPKSINVRTSTGVGQAMGKTIKPKYQEVADTTINGGELNKIAKSGGNAANAIKNVGKESNKTKEQLKDLDKNADKSSSTFKKLIRSVGRIAFYRTIRFAIKQLTDAFRDGFQNVVQYDKETNEAMSRIMNSVNQLKNSLGVGLASVLKSLEPIIVSLTDNMGDFVNALNLALAKMRGDNTYLKAIKQNEDYAKSLEKTKKSLLSFDKFEALSDKKEESPFEIASVDSEENTIFGVLTELLKIVKVVASPLKSVLELINEIFNALEPLMPIILSLVDLFVGVLSSWIEMFKSIVSFVVGIVQNLSGIGKFISGIFTGTWEDIANGFADMVNGIVNMFIGFVNFILDGINLLLEPFDWIANLFGGNIKDLQIDYKMNWKPYANGGTFNKGTAFIAGEAGAEAVYNTSGGNGGVVNIEQFTTAMYNALSMYGVARSTDVHFGGDVYIDRTKAGQLLESSVYGEGVRVGHFAKR